LKCLDVSSNGIASIFLQLQILSIALVYFSSFDLENTKFIQLYQAKSADSCTYFACGEVLFSMLSCQSGLLLHDN